MTRQEFAPSVKRAALERSGGQCEATGERYGLPPGVRCQRPVGPGSVNFEHYPRGAHDPAPETRMLVNCTAICPQCNQYANNKHDTPREAKMKDVKYKHDLHVARASRKAGLDVPDPKRPRERKERPKMKSPAFRKDGPKQKIPSKKFSKRTP